MKNCLPFFIALLCYCYSPAQSFVSGATPITAAQGQQVAVTIMGQNTQFSQASGAVLNGNSWWLMRTSQTVVSDTELVANFNIPWSMPADTYWVYVDPYLAWYGFAVTPASQPKGFVQGSVYRDGDNNCILGPGDVPLANRIVTFVPGPYYLVTDSMGNFSDSLPVGNYTATYNASAGYPVSCPIGAAYSANISTQGSSVTGLDFALDSVPAMDLRATANIPNLRRGLPRPAHLGLVNEGTLPFNGTIYFVIDPLSNAAGYSIPPTAQSGDTAFWAVSLPPEGTWATSFSLTGNLILQLGDTLRYLVTADKPAVDINHENNCQVLDRVTIGSYDPNDKAVSLANGDNADGLITPNDSTLLYRVRFQNTGTDTAFTVIIRDTLDGNLDLSTLSVRSASHAYEMSLGQTGELEFLFPNILLPDSFVNEPASNGFIIFEVNRRTGLFNGTNIPNRASIYFDFNAPIITNWVNTTVCEELTATYNYITQQLSLAASPQIQGAWTNYSWDFGDGNFGTGAAAVHTYANPGTYNVCLTVNSVCRSYTYCQSVTVCPDPNAAYTSTPNQLSVGFQDQSAPSVIGWLWNFGDGNTSTAQNPSHTYAAPGNYQVCLTVTDSCGTDNFCSNVSVNCAAPSAGFSDTSSQLQTTFNNLTTGFGTISYGWSFGDGGSSAAASPTHTYSAPGTYTVCLIASSVCGTSTFCDTVTVSCLAPSVNFSSSTNLLSANFSGQASGQGPLVYAWDFGDGNTGAGVGPAHTYATSGTYTACLTVTGLCGTTSFCDAVTVSCPTPSSAFSWTQAQLLATFTDQSTAQLGASYTWDFGDGGTSNQPSPTHQYAAPGDYVVCLTLSDPCGTSTHCDTVTAACAVPAAAFNFNATGLQVQFSDQTQDNIVAWAWDFGDGFTSNAANPTHNYAGIGPYTVCLAVENACGARDTNCTVLPTLVGVESRAWRTVSLYPNPNSGRFQLEAELNASGNLKIRVFDVRGKLTADMDLGPVSGRIQREIDLGNVPAGRYLLQVELDGQTVNRVFTVQR
ncbi:MAG: PKD domain-containing protein [Bacteroidota bacterium]